MAAARTRTVHSQRSAAVLGVLARQLRRRRRNEHVAAFLPTLHTALAGRAGPA